ncbi:hypothetical protein JF544_01810 [Halobacillus kuroshimensis]|uniref:Uncharacterized protein n=1 Tax=Halobacillus kuroshimensis TaxID=302481 RepID=A0ABS3DRK8_9BACI|nr:MULTISPECIES: hypothetical protein [Halobacillus]MBN8233956.1 hypothetical protein [Halobacillus kuroshimensis]
MGVLVMFLLLSTVTPFLFLQLKKPALAVAQSVLLVGMWVYYFQIILYTAPAAFSVTWSMFYAGLIGSQIAWILFIIATVEQSPGYQANLAKEKDTLPS